MGINSEKKTKARTETASLNGCKEESPNTGQPGQKHGNASKYALTDVCRGVFSSLNKKKRRESDRRDRKPFAPFRKTAANGRRGKRRTPPGKNTGTRQDRKPTLTNRPNCCNLTGQKTAPTVARNCYILPGQKTGLCVTAKLLYFGATLFRADFRFERFLSFVRCLYARNVESPYRAIKRAKTGRLVLACLTGCPDC